MANLLDNGFARLSGQPETLIAAPMLDDAPPAGAQVAVGDIEENSFPTDKTPAKPMSKARKAELAQTWGIQVGAYGSREKALEQASLALSRMVTLYPNADVQVQAIRDSKERTLYRAQVVGLSQSDVALACQVADIKNKAGCASVPPEKTQRSVRR